MTLSEKSSRELLKLSRSASFRKEMEQVTVGRHNPFIKNGKIDADTYLEFVTQFNAFINHQPKPFRFIIEKEMKI
jgi:hypothetical protein